MLILHGFAIGDTTWTELFKRAQTSNTSAKSAVQSFLPRVKRTRRQTFASRKKIGVSKQRKYAEIALLARSASPVVIFRPTFVPSRWCVFAFDRARFYFAETGRNSWRVSTFVIVRLPEKTGVLASIHRAFVAALIVTAKRKMKNIKHERFARLLKGKVRRALCLSPDKREITVRSIAITAKLLSF